MNQAQTESIITKLIVGGTTALAMRFGIGTPEWEEFVAWVVGGVFIVGTALWSHYFHSATPNQPTK